MRSAERVLVGRDRTNRMLDTYAGLLSARQQDLLRRYFHDDLSLGEIAAQMRISRQAVHDALRRAQATLERFEAALGLVARAQRDVGQERPDRGRSNPAPVPAGAPPRRPAAEHYFARTPASRPRPKVIRAQLRGRPWTFQVASGVFASRGIDPGTRLLIETMRIGPRDRVLDLGCGYGAIGLVAAALAPRGSAWLIDINERAAALARANARENRLANTRVLVGDGAGAIGEQSMDVVLTNPPIRAGRGAVVAFIDGAFHVLRPGGRFYLVARTAQGARTIARLMEKRFEHVRQVCAASGYRVYEATRQPGAPAPANAPGSGPRASDGSPASV